MLTAATDEDTVRHSGALGAFAYLVKPVSLTLLTERLNAALRKRDVGKVLKKRTPQIGAASAAAAGEGGLHRLIYSSRFGPAMPHEAAAQHAEIDRIMAVAVRNNAALDVTGLLLVHHGHFIQALEGAAPAVRAIYNRILPDPRHQDVTIINIGVATDRKFRNWQMCAWHLDPADSAILATLDLKGAFDPAALTASGALNLLTAVANIRLGRLRPAAPPAP
jgi:hypothetical protein